MKKLLITLIILPMLLVGCETIRSITDRTTEIIESNPLIAKTTIQYATLRFIDGDAEKSQGVLDFVKDSRNFIDSSSIARVDELSNNLKDRINWDSLSTANARVINTLFDTVQSYINKKVDGEDLSPESIVTIHSVLSWMEEVAELSKLGVYAPNPID